ncbi:MAG: J domain-containing protein [Polyangiales bacterium]
MKDRADHLRELELGENATPDEIRQAYRDLARVWHPDRFADDPRIQAKASEKLRRVAEWEPWAWVGIGSGIALPVVTLFLLPRETVLAAGAFPWFVSGVSSVSRLVLAGYRFSRIREETDDAIRAIGSADVTCGRCGRAVVARLCEAADRALVATPAIRLTQTRRRARDDFDPTAVDERGKPVSRVNTTVELAFGSRFHGSGTRFVRLARPSCPRRRGSDRLR